MSIFKNGVVTVPKERHEEVRQLVLDAQLPIYKIIGFSIDSMSRHAGATDIASRSHLLLENTTELMLNLSKVIFLPPKAGSLVQRKILTTRRVQEIMEPYSRVTSVKETFFTEGEGLDVVDESLHLYTPQGDVTLKLIIYRGTGQLSFEEALEKVNTIVQNSKDAYLSIPTNFTLHHYLRILPPIGNLLRYRLYNGMTDEMINRIWDEYESKK